MPIVRALLEHGRAMGSLIKVEYLSRFGLKRERNPLDVLGTLRHRPQVVAHEIELMFAVALSGMAVEFRGWRGKESTAGIDEGKAKHVPEKAGSASALRV